jgi:hypothetical protein
MTIWQCEMDIAMNHRKPWRNRTDLFDPMSPSLKQPVPKAVKGTGVATISLVTSNTTLIWSIDPDYPAT